MKKNAEYPDYVWRKTRKRRKEVHFTSLDGLSIALGRTSSSVEWEGEFLSFFNHYESSK